MYRDKTWVMYKNIKTRNDRKILSTLPKLHTNCHHNLKKHGPNSGTSYRRQVVHPRPQARQGEPVAKPETVMLTILNLVYKSDIRGGHCISSNPLLKNECPWAETSKGCG